MTEDQPMPRPDGNGSECSKDERSAKDGRPPRHTTRPVSRRSEAIIKEVSARRRTAMKVLANR